jgi:hypothetical protein
MITEKMIAALTQAAFDGTETFSTINSELKNYEDELAASAIRHAVLAQYQNCIPTSIAIEIVTRLLEDGELG